MAKSKSVFQNLLDAAESERQWAIENPTAPLPHRVKRTVRAVEDATGADLKPSVGRIISLYAPIPVHQAHALDAAIDAWGDRQKAKSAQKKRTQGIRHSTRVVKDPYNPFK